MTIKPNADGSLALGGDGEAVTVRADARDGRLYITPQRKDEAGYVATVVREGDVLHVFSPGARARLTRIDRLAPEEIRCRRADFDKAKSQAKCLRKALEEENALGQALSGKRST